ncbi:MAG TPA: L-seryl-tRNA(Sec) selenium transferase [Ignavibacteriales bacterium]|nr:L-seryl-tRNA(Sec) selenium transferase [Ignavibacteriales bacterium]
MANADLKKIPGVDFLMQDPDVMLWLKSFSPGIVKTLIRDHLETVRQDIINGCPAPSVGVILRCIKEKLNSLQISSLKRVINATGIILNTNLGRAPLGPFIADEVKEILSGYSNLEVELRTGKRSKRVLHVIDLIKLLTGAEDAVVVNNNAAAVSLIMKVFAAGREVIVSRGELVEIGGSFRMPDIIKASGSVMVEAGTTNRTNIHDYENAISERSAILLKVHKSNYEIRGFTREVSIPELSQIAREKNLLLVYDIGSGLLSREGMEILKSEPTVKESIASGCDIITFSCDKLIGGPQAGIIAGRKVLIEKIAKDPLIRTYRADKIILSLLASVLRCHLNHEERNRKLPVYTMLCRCSSAIKSSAYRLSYILKDAGITSEVQKSSAYAGGGTMPGREIESYSIRLLCSGKRKDFAQKIYFSLLNSRRPVMALLKKGEIYFDLMTIFEDEITSLAEEIIKAYEEYNNGNGRAR